eukprot:TRINITY_DN28368_c0_g1_i1.p1 TRINITY_DN28368_c0_g1~~TRINITY_DN28368_c0_g1_i1.p1  ORF type:complete len:384 (+),score=63.10 TRINITY_DN28368_c0_g1_i1:946-2097(+)
MSSGGQIRVRTDLEKQVLLTNFDKRLWVRSDDDWNFYWASVYTIRQLFHPDSGQRLTDSQIVNHFPNHYELTRKDLMVKNIKRYKKERERDPSVGVTIKGETIADFVPLTYTLPSDYTLFVEEFKRDPGSLWIVKPSARAQGKGIFIVTKLAQIKKWAREKWSSEGAPGASKDQFVISKYVENPLLIGGKKFDLRLYVLVTSYKPMRAFLHRVGFARFCSVKYNKDVNDLDNLFVHLTNVAIQKQGEDYNDLHGGKWQVHNLRLYVESTAGKTVADALFQQIHFVIVESLRACSSVIINDKHCFELYGYDILVDADYRPWLLEVNASPSLTYTTTLDRVMKTEVLGDAFDLLVPPGFPDSERPYREHRVAPDVKLGGFQLLTP